MSIPQRILPLLLLLLTPTLYAQNSQPHTHQQNELGISLAAAYEIEHHEWLPAIHAHYFRAFTPQSRWAWGAGVEILPTDETHIEFAAGIRYQPLPHLHLSLMPAVSFATRPKGSLHAEVAYELLQIGNLHIGAVAGYAWSPHHSHSSIGIHISWAFSDQ